MLDVIDPGVGFEVHSINRLPTRQGGFGLFSIRERLKLMGGTVDIHSVIGEGTTVRIRMALKPEIEQLITLAKKGDLHARRQALKALGQDKFSAYKLFEDIAPRYSSRPGGYTRILKLGPRKSDATEMVLIELV